MKKLFILMIATSVLVFTSCTSDPCEDKTCNSQGTPTPTANDESCDCACFDGFTGSDCESVVINKLAGSYSVNEPGSSPSTYDVTVTTTGNQVLFQNFANVWDTKFIAGNVSGTSIVIPSIEPNNDKYFVATKAPGTIAFNNGKAVITMVYKVTTPSNVVKEYEITMTQK